MESGRRKINASSEGSCFKNNSAIYIYEKFNAVITVTVLFLNKYITIRYVPKLNVNEFWSCKVIL